MKANRPEITNRKAYHEYFILETLQCGIALSGNEVKSLKAGKSNINEAWCTIKDGQLDINNMYIAKYDKANNFDVKERRNRKLLAHKNEIRKLNQKISEKGLTIIPLKIYWIKDKCKIDIGLAKGKHSYDKRESIKAKDIQRDSERELAKN